MSRFTSSFGASALVVLAGFAAAGQADAEAPRAAAPTTAERSWAIEASLADIDQDRAAFVHELLMSWAPYVDASVYDLWSELQSVAMEAPAWQLYGASLVGDFTTMVRILRGEEGAGAYIDALAEPEARAAHDPVFKDIDPNAFPTGTDDNLVYVPVEPCRVVDTRGTGVRTGPIPANGQRSFHLTSSAFTAGQGGGGRCAGLPGFSHAAWAVNVTVTGYSGIGGLKVWGFGGEEPNASIINFAPGSFALANGLILTGCYACADDITIRAFGAATHVVIDVMGYFRQAQTSPATATRVAGATVSLPGGTAGLASGGACPAGTRLVGGEVSWPVLSAGTLLGEMARQSATTMRFWVVNQEAVSRDVVAYSMCLDTPIKAVP